ncbi:MAG: hypothetical protein ACE5FD_15105 [Anaerolineae bacterium]
MNRASPLKHHASRPNTFKPVLLPRPDNQAERYEAALQLVDQIDRHLTAGTRHYRTRSGELLRTLDQVVNAILDDNLLLDAEERVWTPRLARAA